MKKSDKSLIAVGIALAVLGILLIGIPALAPFDEKTVTKVSGIYENPIFLTFHWITADEIQVGEKITIDIQLRGLPYTENMTLNDIEIHFKEEQLNYWSYDGDIKNNEIRKIDFVVLKYDRNNDVFKSDPIDIRFIIPTDISIELCDYNLEEPCNEIKNIIHPASFDLRERILTNRIALTFTLVVAGLSVVGIWSKFR